MKTKFLMNKKIFFSLILFAILPVRLCLAQILYGDVNDNGRISSMDAAFILQYSAEIIELTPEQIERADVSGNGRVTSYDAVLILRWLVGWFDRFPVYEKKAVNLTREAKVYLGSGNIEAANSNFRQALELAPQGQEANFFYSITRILYTFNSTQNGPDPARIDSMKELLDHFGVSSQGRNLLNWTAVGPEQLVLPDNLSTSGEAGEYLRRNILPELKAALANLERVDREFNVSFNFDTLGQSGRVEIDYGDVCMYKSALRLISGIIKSFASYNVEIGNRTINSALNSDDFDVKSEIIDRYPGFLTIDDVRLMLEARDDFAVSISEYFKASEFIRAESDTQGDDLLSFAQVDPQAKDSDILDKEAKFREILTDIKDSLTGRAPVPFKLGLSQFLNLGFCFENPVSPRDFLTTQGFNALFDRNILGQMDYALYNFNKVGRDFSQLLTFFDDRQDNDLNIEFIDIALLKSALKFSKAAIQIILSYDTNIDVYDLFLRRDANNLNVQEDIINTYTNLGNVTEGSHLAQSKSLFEEGINEYLAVSELIRARAIYNQAGSLLNALTKGSNLTNLLSKEENLRVVLGDTKSSLYGVRRITDLLPDDSRDDSFLLNLSQFFDTQPSMRSFAPAIIFNPANGKNTAVAGSFPDPTFGGIFPDTTQEDLTRILIEKKKWR